MAAQPLSGTLRRISNPLRLVDFTVENSLIRKNEHGVSLFLLPDGENTHGPLLKDKKQCFILNSEIFDNLAALALNEADVIDLNSSSALHFTSHFHIRPRVDSQLTLAALTDLLAIPDLWIPCDMRAGGKPIDLTQHFSRPRKSLSFPLEVHRLFVSLFDLIEALEDEEDYLKCFLLMNKLYFQPLSSLSQLTYCELLFAQYVCGTYETATLSEEIESGFDEVWLVILRSKLASLIDAARNLGS